jgi:hypothetical protein
VQTGQDIVPLQLRMVSQDLILAHASGNEVEDRLHRPSHVADAGFAVTNVPVERNAAQIRHDGFSVLSMHQG